MVIQFEQTTKQYILARRYILLSRSYLGAGIALLIAMALLYLFNAVALLGFILGIFIATGLLMGVSMLAGFYMFKNKKGVVPMSVEVTNESLRLTIGGRQSKNIVTKVLEQSKVVKVWTNGKCIFVNYGLQTYPILVPDNKYASLIEALTDSGWFVKRRAMFKRRATLFAIGVIGGALGVLALHLFPSEPSTHFTVPTIVEVKESDILPGLNAARADRGVGALAFDQNLATSANRSCHDMETNKYYGSKNPKNGHNGYEYISEIYPDSYVDEVTLGVTNLSAADVVAQWLKDNSTKEWVLSATYTKAGVATCKYTADGQYQTLVILHIAS